MDTPPLTHGSPRRTLITGGAGFIGSHLADRLIAGGDAVCVIDNLSTGSRANIAHLESHARFRFVAGDVRNTALIDPLAEGHDRIIHLAAVVGVQKVMADPFTVVEENIFGSRAVLEAARRAGAAVFVASSSEIYGKSADVPFAEDDDRLLGPPQAARWSYSTSKAVDEIMAMGYVERHGMSITVGRLFNTIGQRQTGAYGMVVPRFVQQALAAKPLTVYGCGEQTRSFCDVRDTVRAITDLMDEPGACGRCYNIGSEREISIRDLASEVLSHLAPDRADDGDAVRSIAYDDAYPQGYEEFPRRVPDISRIRKRIGWQPEYSLADTLEWIADGIQLDRSA